MKLRNYTAETTPPSIISDPPDIMIPATSPWCRSVCIVECILAHRLSINPNPYQVSHKYSQALAAKYYCSHMTSILFHRNKNACMIGIQQNPLQSSEEFSLAPEGLPPSSLCLYSPLIPPSVTAQDSIRHSSPGAPTITNHRGQWRSQLDIPWAYLFSVTISQLVKEIPR